MKKKILYLLSLLFISNIYSQKNITINIAPTLSYRGFLIELADAGSITTSNPGYTNNFGEQFEVKNIGADFSSSFFHDKLTIQLSTYFRYGFLYYDRVLDLEKKSFKADVFVDFLYNFKKKNSKSFSFYVGAGLGRLNIGTYFRYAYIEAVDSTGPYYKVGEGAFSFSTAKLVIGVRKGRWDFSLSAIASPDRDYRPNPSFAAEPKISYRLFSFKIPVKTHR